MARKSTGQPAGTFGTNIYQYLSSLPPRQSYTQSSPGLQTLGTQGYQGYQGYGAARGISGRRDPILELSTLWKNHLIGKDVGMNYKLGKQKYYGAEAERSRNKVRISENMADRGTDLKTRKVGNRWVKEEEWLTRGQRDTNQANLKATENAKKSWENKTLYRMLFG